MRGFRAYNLLLFPFLIVSHVALADGEGVRIANWPATQNVGGTVNVGNWPGLLPVSLSVMPTTPVTGTFWPAVQPVSGSVSVGNFPASQTVTGTFWQATQPISIASMPSTPVTGTFWPATQPVSGSVIVTNLPGPATTATVARVTVGATVVTLLASNPNRRRAIIFNETGTLRVKLGANAGLADYTYEVLSSAGNNRQDVDNYSGVITGIKVSGSGAVQVTEF